MKEQQHTAIRYSVSVDRRDVCSRLSDCLECYDGVLTERRDATASANDACCVLRFETFFGIGVETTSAAHDVIANNHAISLKIDSEMT